MGSLLRMPALDDCIACICAIVLSQVNVAALVRCGPAPYFIRRVPALIALKGVLEIGLYSWASSKTGGAFVGCSVVW